MTTKGWKLIETQFHRVQSPHTSPSTPLPLFLPHLCLGEQKNFPVLEKTEAHRQGSISTVHTPSTPMHIKDGAGRAGNQRHKRARQASQSRSTHVRGFALGRQVWWVPGIPSASDLPCFSVPVETGAQYKIE